MSRGEPIPWHIILFITLVMMLVVLVCSGCLGIGERGKSMRIQVPALLDVEIDYLDQEAPPIDQAAQWRDFFVPKKESVKSDTPKKVTIDSLFKKPDDNATD